MTNPNEDNPQITDEMLGDFLKNPDKLNDLSPSKLNNVLEALDERDAAKVNEPKPAPTEAEPEPSGDDTDGKPDGEPSADPKGKEDEIAKLRESLLAERQKTYDDLNKITQQTNSTKKRIEKRKAEFKELSEKEIDLSKIDTDPIDENSFKAFVKKAEESRIRSEMKIEALERQLLAQDQDNLDYYNMQAATSKERAVFGEVENLQKDYPVLQTTEPIEALNSGYAAFLDGLVSVAGLKDREDLKDKDKSYLRDIALGMYDADPVFKQKANGMGVNVPAGLRDSKEMEKYEIITSLYQKAQDMGGTIKGHWLEHLDKTGKLESMYNAGKREAALEASRKTADAIENNSPTPLDPSDGSVTKPSGDEEMTMEKAGMRAQALTEKGKNSRLTSDEVKELDSILTFIDSQEEG